MKNLKKFVEQYPAWVALIIASAIVFSILAYAIYTDTAATILLIIIAFIFILSSVPTPPPPPSPDQIAEAAGTFLERACEALKDRLKIFQGLYYDTIPIEGTPQHRYFPRWEWYMTNCNGTAIVRLGLLRLSKEALSAETLKQERRVLRELLADDIKRGLVNLLSVPYGDIPTLYLLDIKQEEAYITFDFV